MNPTDILKQVLSGPVVDPDPCWGRTDLLVPMSRVLDLVDEVYGQGFVQGQIQLAQRGLTLRTITIRAIKAEVARQGGNVTRAAKVLGIGRTMIYDYLKKKE